MRSDITKYAVELEEERREAIEAMVEEVGEMPLTT